MKSKKIVPNLNFFHAIIPYDPNNFRNDSFVTKILDQMKFFDVSPDIKFFNIVINNFSQRKNFSLALKYFESLAFYSLQPNLVTFSTLIDKYLESFLYDEANSLLDQMLKLGKSFSNK